MQWIEDICGEQFWNAVKLLVESGGGFEDFSELIDGALNGGAHSDFFSDLVSRFNPYSVNASVYYGFHDEFIIEARKQFNFFEQELEEEYVYRINSLQGAVDVIVSNQVQRLKHEFEKRVRNRQELDAIYKLIESKFFDNQEFRKDALGRLRKDIKESLELCETPIFYQMLVKSCNPDEIVAVLANTHFEDLVEEFGAELKLAIRDKYEKILAEEIMRDLRIDKNFIESVKSNLVKEIAEKLFL